MLRKMIAAAALAAFAAIAVTPSTALARDRDHGGWQARVNYVGQHGGRWVGQGGHGQGGYDPRYNRSNGYYGNSRSYAGDRSYRQQRDHGRDRSSGYNQNGYGGHDQGSAGH